ncbi:helix-turn-helix transcriptional regulator [Campylobacter showae]|jgi:hypothetical protein|uniref:helix-turn-helix transcriptional regulator n=1 Tax=Campylobacter showae TaxID=204 RepID=UPI0003111185|nr:helix-turn-helix domain-containing protein [Campylobacter showae]
MQQTTHERKKLRAYEVAKIYGVSQSTIWNYTKKGYLKPVKVGERVTLFDALECDQFFNGKNAERDNETGTHK